MTTKARLWPDTPTHPGEILADELSAREISTAELAELSGADIELITEVLSGTAPVTAELAWSLESAFEGISARFWMGLQTDYDLGVERLRRRAG
jgi:addiction module HigA family antidote